jgi:alkaline phosphatase D
MHSTFIADGPAFVSGAVVEPFEIVQLYNIMARTLGIAPAANDGDIETVQHLLAK